MTLRPYPEYKASDVDWLGNVPAHWEIVPLFGEYEEKQIKNTGLVENTVLSLSYGRIVIKPVEKLHGLVPASFETYQIVDPGDIIIRPTDLQNDHTSLRIGFSQYRGIITSAYMCLRTWNDLSSEYGYHVLNVFDLTKAIYGYGSGLRQNLSFDDIKRVGVPVPPPDEQEAIVRFLDAAENRIRRYIRAKQKLIKLLNEQKQAIIQQAVTRGLNPDAPMKDSGVEWLGEIPSHWELRRAKDLCVTIVDCKNRTPEIVENGDYVVVRTSNIKNGRLLIEDATRTDYENYLIWTQRGAPQQGDVFFTREAPAGEACLVPENDNLCLGQRMMYFRPNKNLILPDFLLLQIYGSLGRTYISLALNGSTVGHLKVGQVKAFPFLYCSIEEQQTIVDSVQSRNEPIDYTIMKAQYQINLIQEYRTRLIADVVTGKVDVRGLAFQMPEEFEDDALVDDFENEEFEDDELLDVSDAD